MSALVDSNLLDTEAARRLTHEITDGLENVHGLIVRAWEGQAWRALGYPSWDAWIDENFRGLQLRPPREQREEVVQSMRESGMSIRAISSAVDLGRGTVERALSGGSGVPNGTPHNPTDEAESAVVGLDGKSYSPSSRRPEESVGKTEDSHEDASLDDLGIAVIDRSLEATLSSGSAAKDEDSIEAEIEVPWWEESRSALIAAEEQCRALLKARKSSPRLVEDPEDPGVETLAMAAARSALAASGVIADLGVGHVAGNSRLVLRRALASIVGALDDVIGDLEEVSENE
ncbi:hypothetical protein [Kocuria marina]|uniref:hypothetical protein n=1 Tax=Kocuria marina TaxID=223184 RepID=UPI0022E31F2A|nr:hypothetical protein [Kocuria marina]